MIFGRKCRRLLSFYSQHRYFTTIFIIITILIGLYPQEIFYYLHIKTLNLQPYQTAVTMWSSDYHIR
jgi:hypothetical protein